MYVYCGNDPILYRDSSGCTYTTTLPNGSTVVVPDGGVPSKAELAAVGEVDYDGDGDIDNEDKEKAMKKLQSSSSSASGNSVAKTAEGLGKNVVDAVNNIGSKLYGSGSSTSRCKSSSQKTTYNTSDYSKNISSNDSKRIQNAANRTHQVIVVVGSRAAGTATDISDWDYIMSGNSAQRHSAASSVPRGIAGGANGSGIDIMTSYPNSPHSVIIDRSRPYIIFFHNKKELTDVS